ncbi:CehA/McbA family metallohydrolase [Bacillus sp. FJAT-29790]|uniref:CehA/McbA family metallohydrolase n=1 Tax=Bacillus sp. FJAT-29790 TaxID=1895002 RepID=UPI001C243F1B|nr:CehA/McbA family metallohydrolase [Bacillus sp. FJAT-29790]MBU8880965.1 CehA/McbA family metallohydrolase [Bacillus sp. FJAT-29790]
MHNFIRKHKKWFNIALTVLMLFTLVMPPSLMANLPKAEAAEALPQSSVADHVVISQVYGYGGSGPNEYLYKFVELYNPTDADVDLKDWSLQYAAAGATSAYSQKIALTGVIKARGYYLIQAGSNANPPVEPANGKPLPTPDDKSAGSGSFNFSATTGGKIALSNQKANSITGSADPSVVDFVGYGTASDSLGKPAVLPASRTFARKTNTGLDPSVLGDGNGFSSNSNLEDFAAASPFPRNSSYQSEPGNIDLGAKNISDIRINDDNGIPTTLGNKATIEGIVTAVKLGTDKTSFFIQDSTGGINVISTKESSFSIKEGQKLKVTGHVAFNKGFTQLVLESMVNIETGNVLSPEEINIADLGSYDTAEPLEGKLVSFTGQVSNIPSNGTDLNITVADGENTAVVKILGMTGIDVKSALEVSDTYTFVGIVGQSKSVAPYTNGYYLTLRTSDDIKGELTLSHEPITETYPGMDVSFTAIAKYADSVTLYYRDIQKTEYQSIDMIKDGFSFNGKILEKDVPENFQYYIEAQSGSKTKFVGTSEKPFDVVVVTKQTGPSFYDEQPQGKIETQHPVISVKMSDPYGVDTSKVTIKIDGSDLTKKAVITDSEIKLALTPNDDLNMGSHTVIVEAADKLGNLSTYTWSFEVMERFKGGHHYLGTTHNHTRISHDAVGEPEDALKAAIEHEYDWFAFSDHSHDIDAELVGQDSVDHNGMQERKGGEDWQLTKKLAKDYTKNDEFVVFPAFEMTSTTWGHSNVFGTENFIDRKQSGGIYQNLKDYYAWVLTYDDIVAQFNHPAMSKDAFDNFIPYDKNLDKLFTMLEVGNGSGKYSYVNTENKFFNALDLGWHVAPTYGEDNHDATWGKTNKRTVIVANDLSQDSLLDAMKKMRVYFTEDKDFTMDVLASGFYMGSTTDTKQLNFDIKGTSPNRTISQVEIVTNGATVVKSITPNSKELDWKPEPINVVGGQQWYVVRVTLDNGDRAYSAPIWSPEEELSVKVSNLETVEGAIIANSPAKLKAGISNLGVKNVGNLVAHFYYDSVDQAHFIGDASIETLAANSSTSVNMTWANPVAGEHNIIVVLEAKDGNNLGENQYVKPFKVKEALNIKVMLDASHKNENSSTDAGTYKDNMKELTTKMRQEAYTVVENVGTITAEILKDVKVLVITHPATDYSASEIKVISDFVHTGGSILLTGKSNYKVNQSPNSLLDGIGSSILINNDGVFDESKSGNFWSNPLTSNFSVRAHPKAMLNDYRLDFVTKLDYYSGASLAQNDGNGNKIPLTDEDANVTILVRGNETTFQDNIKPDTAIYNSYKAGAQPGNEVTGGTSIPLAAAELVGKGRIFVTAMNIFNDKQMDQSFEPKGNVPFALNIVNWLAEREVTKVTQIGDARHLPEDKDVVVQGKVTSAAGVFFDAFYVQDETGGIMAFNEVPDNSLQEGDIVRVYGHIKTFENNLEVEFGNFNESVVKVSSGEPLQPKTMTTKEATSDSNQGQLIKVAGKVKDNSQAEADSPSYIINDGSGDVLVFVDGYIINQSGPIPKLKVGETLEVVGYTAKTASGPQVRVGNTKLMQKTADVVDEGPGIPEDKEEMISVTITPDQLTKGNKGKVSVQVPNHTSEIILPYNTVDLLGKNDFEVKTDDITMNVPLKLLKDITSKLLTKELKDSTISLQMKQLSTSEEKDLISNMEAISQTKIKQMSKIYDFALSITTKNGKSVSLTKFNHPFMMELEVDPITNPKLATLYKISDEGKLEYEPIEGKIVSGKMVAEIGYFGKYVVLDQKIVNQDSKKKK